MWTKLRKVFVVFAAVSGAIFGGMGLSLSAAYLTSVLTGNHDFSFVGTLTLLLFPVALLLGGPLGVLLLAVDKQSRWSAPKIRFGVPAIAVFVLLGISLLMTRDPGFWIQATRLTDNHDPQTRAIYIDRLVALGPSAIDPVVEEVRKSGTRSRGTGQYIAALKRLGPQAQARLRSAIETEDDNRRRVKLIDALQESYSDFSCVDLYLDTLKLSGEHPNDMHLNWQLTRYFEEEVPAVFTGDKIARYNPKFVAWYQSKSQPKGPLPPWKPK
jgi:hypothetical protein